MTGERRQFNEGLDATRRTRLANERTYLAWWRTGLTALAVALAAGKVVPQLTDETDTWPYQLLGAGFALLGIACIVYALRRERQVEAGADAGRFRAARTHLDVADDGRRRGAGRVHAGADGDREISGRGGWSGRVG